jgi:hypothetical protein
LLDQLASGTDLEREGNSLVNGDGLQLVEGKQISEIHILKVVTGNSEDSEGLNKGRLEFDTH